VACAPAASPSMQLSLSDDRHGLIRAAAALAALTQLHAGQEALGLTQTEGPHQRQRQQRPQRRGVLRRRGAWGGGSCSPARTATASVSVAAGEVVAQKGAVAQKVASSLAKSSSRPLQQLLAGGVAGAVSKTLVAPLERVSTMLMTDGHRAGFGPSEALAHAWREGGLAGLFRGNAATLAKVRLPCGTAEQQGWNYGEFWPKGGGSQMKALGLGGVLPFTIVGQA
jgi:hypothetical protein